MEKNVIILVLIGCCLVIQGKQFYKGDQLFRIEPKTTHQADYLSNLDLDVWGNLIVGKPVTIHVKVHDIKHVARLLVRGGIQYRVVSTDLQSLVDEDVARRQLNEGRNIDFYEDYQTYEAHQARLEDIATRCGERCDLFSIGDSFYGKNLTVLKIIANDGNTDKRAIWIDAGIHAREWISPSTAFWFIDRLVDDYGVDPITTRIVDAYDWYIMPSVNPDGYEYSYKTERLWRTTRSEHPGVENECPGCDCNRNFDFHWSTIGYSRDPCSLTYSGVTASSEAETRAIQTFVTDNKEIFDFFVTMHSYSQLWMTPYGYTKDRPTNFDNMMGAGNAAAAALEAVHGTKYIVGQTADILYQSSGTSRDWAKGVPEIPYVYTIELRDTGEYQFELPPDQIIPSGEETWAGIQAMVEYVLDLEVVNKQ